MIIKLVNLIPTFIISSRELVHNLAKTLKIDKKTEEIILDFTKIEFISRSAAHELLKLKAKHSNLQFANMDKEVAKMTRLVAANIAYPKENKQKFKPQKTSLSSLLAR